MDFLLHIMWKTTDNYCIILGGLYAGNMDIVSKREEWQNLDD